MFLLIEISSFAAVKALLVGIPESIELFAFGVLLILGVMLLRWLMNRGNHAKTDEEFSEKGLSNN